MMRVQSILLVWSLGVLNTVYCQGINIPTDTSYTVSGTYWKLRKNYPFIRPVQAAAPHDIVIEHDVVYKEIKHTPYGKRRLHVDLFIPKARRKACPALVFIHGGGWRAGNKSMNTPMAEQLALRGYVVASVEYRLSLEEKYPAAVQDIKDCIAWLRLRAHTYNIDRAHIAIGGASAGGQLAALIGSTNNKELFNGIYKNSNDVQAIVDLDGLLDFTHVDNLSVKRNEKSADVNWLEGTYEERPERWREASAITWADAKCPPFLCIKSSQKRFHAGCDEMVTKLGAHGIHTKVVTFEDAPHSYWLFEPWFERTVNEIDLFLGAVFGVQK